MSGAPPATGADVGRAVTGSEPESKDSKDMVEPLKTTTVSPEANHEVTAPSTRHAVAPSAGSMATTASGCATTIASWLTSHRGGTGAPRPLSAAAPSGRALDHSRVEPSTAAMVAPSLTTHT